MVSFSIQYLQYKRNGIPIFIYFLKNKWLYKFLSQSFILAFCVIYFAGRCCKRWQCEVLQHHHCCGMWPALEGDWDSVMVSGLRAEMWVNWGSVERISLENWLRYWTERCVCVCVCVCIYIYIHIYIFFFSEFGNFKYLYVPEINDQLLRGNRWVCYPSEFEKGFGVMLITHIQI